MRPVTSWRVARKPDAVTSASKIVNSVVEWVSSRHLREQVARFWLRAVASRPDRNNPKSLVPNEPGCLPLPSPSRRPEQAHREATVLAGAGMALSGSRPGRRWPPGQTLVDGH